MTIRRLVFAAIVFTFFGTELSATTYPAASCNESDVQAAYTTEQLTPADGDIITIPAGTCTWTTYWTISPANSITFQGAGAKSATNGGASVTGTDQTTIIHTTQWLQITTRSGKSFRLTGIAAVEATGCSDCSYDSMLRVYGPSTAVRIDHNHFVTAPPSGERMIGIYGSVQGVLDHNVAESYASQFANVQNGREWLLNGVPDTTLGNYSWADDAYWGSSKFFFLEDNMVNNIGPSGLLLTDCASGGRMVVRYGTYNGGGGVTNHEGLTDDRGCREEEVYHNTFHPFQSWQPQTTYVNGQRINDPSGHTQSSPYTPGRTTTCTSGLTTPSWNDSGGTTGPDGTCTWTDTGPYNSATVSSSRAGTVLTWDNTAVATPTIFTPAIDRLIGNNGIFSPQRPGMCGNGDPHNGWAGTVTTNGTAVTLVTGNNYYGANIKFPATSPASWPYSLANPYIHINGVQYVVAKVNTGNRLPDYSATSLTLKPPGAGVQSTPVPYYVPSLWDGNIDNTGYPCLDQAGRGKGDLITGSFSAGTRVNSATSTPTWPRERLEPNYLWGNSDTASQSSVAGINQSVFRNNRDFFYDGMSASLSSLTQTSQTAPFNATLVSLSVSSWTLGSHVLTLTVSSTSGLNTGEIVNTNVLGAGGFGPLVDVTQPITRLTGTTISLPYPAGGYTDSGGAGGTVSSIGVGKGIAANRPTTCTAGVDSANGGVAANGVAYWATDAPNLHGDSAHPGVLSVCTATDTWTPYYSPYTYPHPLTQANPNKPNPPSHLSATVQ